MRLRLAALVALLALLAPVAASAATCPKTTLGDVEDEVMCLVCGTPLALATEAPQANRERALIQRMIDGCATKDQIKDRLVAEFGQRVLATPGGKGFDIAAYLVPALAILLALGAVTAAAIQWRGARRRSRPPGGGDAPAAADTKRLDADMERYEL